MPITSYVLADSPLSDGDTAVCSFHLADVRGQAQVEIAPYNELQRKRMPGLRSNVEVLSAEVCALVSIYHCPHMKRDPLRSDMSATAYSCTYTSYGVPHRYLYSYASDQACDCTNYRLRLPAARNATITFRAPASTSTSSRN